MNPKRMIHGDASPAEVALLRAAEGDRISVESRRRIFGALGIAIPPAFGDAGASGLGTAGSGITTGIASQGAALGVVAKSLLGLVGAGVMSAAVTVGYLELRERPSERGVAPTEVRGQQSTAPREAADPTVRVEEVPDVVSSVEPEEPGPSVTHGAEGQGPEAKSSKRTAAPSADSLSQEFALIESAQAALNQNDGPLTLRRVNQYDRQFPKGKLRAEATMLRIEGLVATGQRAQAARLGAGVLRAAPNGPYSARIRSLLGELDGTDATSR